MNPTCSKKLPNASSLVMLCHRLIVVAALYALILPFFGPLLDHHFAERQHNHQHIYFGATATDHVHFYDLPHPHSHVHDTPATPHGDGTGSTASPNDVISLASHDGVGHSCPSCSIPSFYLAPEFPDLGDSRFLLSPTSQDSLPLETVIPPPKRPPRG
jgi:hypothetical protein